MKILVVEDQPVFRKTLQLALQPLGHEISYANDADSAQRALETIRPDLVVLNVKVQGWLDGFDICGTIRADARLAHTSVYILSGPEDTNAVQHGRHVGAGRCFTQPLRTLNLLGAIEDVARKH